MYALPVAESSIYTTNLYHDTPPICIAILLRKYSGLGSLGHSQIKHALWPIKNKESPTAPRKDQHCNDGFKLPMRERVTITLLLNAVSEKDTNFETKLPKVLQNFAPAFVPKFLKFLLAPKSHQIYPIRYYKFQIKFHYSQGQKHVIQLKNSRELISPNLSSQFQLENSPELIFFSIGRCQLDDFRGTSPGFCLGCPSIFWRWDLNYKIPSN